LHVAVKSTTYEFGNLIAWIKVRLEKGEGVCGNSTQREIYGLMILNGRIHSIVIPTILGFDW
jgi:hypothetical protein